HNQPHSLTTLDQDDDQDEDMDDVPDLDELQWLESHTIDQDDDQFVDDEDDIEHPSPPSPRESHKKPILSLPTIPSPLEPHLQISRPPTTKRFRSDLVQPWDADDDCLRVGNSSDGKRSRTEEDEARFGPDRSFMGPVMGGMEVVEEELEKEERILSRYATEIDGDFVPVTGLDGERVYAKLCSLEMDEDGRKRDLRFGGDSNGLLKESVKVLMQRVEHEEFTKALQASVDGCPTEVTRSKAPVTDEQLWVDKYAPSSFTELLSDEQTNREVLLWLKQWDNCVFGSEIKSTTDDVLTSLRRHYSGSQHSKQFAKSYFGKNKEIRLSSNTVGIHNWMDKENNVSIGIQDTWGTRHRSSGPPEQKILLLCGSPGLGKTTLAHVAARHCGYRVVEINASDDRSSSTLEAKILDVVQMNSVIGDSKPKCLVIDEIDGALGDGKGAIEILLQLVSAERKNDTGKENVSQEGRSSRKKQRNSGLLRPVICICNDLYTPALRPLRQVAKVHIFVQPSVSRVVNRLKYICKKEGVKTSSIALSALAEYTECDIRSCLNTLQFLNKKKERLNVLEISSQVVGQKDASKSAFDIWKEIFQKRTKKQGRKCSECGSSMSKEFEFLYSMISNRGDYDLILDGIHENILQLRYVDPMMQKTVQCLDSLVISDITHRYIMRTQKMFLQVYQPPIPIFIRGLVAQLEKKDIEWPKSFQRHRTVLAERMDMFRTWYSRISPNISRHLSTKSFVEDSSSLMLHIVSPTTLRPVVALHLLSDNEKRDLGKLVNNMVAYAITYKNIQADRSLKHGDTSDATRLSFDPPLSEFIDFKGYKSDHFDLALAVKQVLVHEVEKQKILQGSLSRSADLLMHENHASIQKDIGVGVSSKSSYANGSSVKKINGKSPTNQKSGLSVSSNSLLVESGNAAAADKAKSVEQTKKPSGSLLNFFDRIINDSDGGSQPMHSAMPKPKTAKRDSHPLLFKFHEGFTNAVKRPVRMREFLL
ncbi:P-loop containing nucleoside triphosphate hydrolases superfamily protein, partial [Striga hermonthica]